MQHQPSLKANSNGWCSRKCHNFPKENCDVAPAFAEEVPMCRRRILHGTDELPPTLGEGAIPDKANFAWLVFPLRFGK